MCETLCKLTLVKVDILRSIQESMNYRQRNVCMKFYDASGVLNLENNISRIRLVVRLLQVRDSMNCQYDEIPDNAILQHNAFTSKSVSSVELCYSNIGCKVLGILHGLEKLHSYCFVSKVCIITDDAYFFHKAAVVELKI